MATAPITKRGFRLMLATAIAAGVAFYILREHWAHALGLLPYALFLACPLMHLLTHRGHGGRSDHHDGSDDTNRPQ